MTRDKILLSALGMILLLVFFLAPTHNASVENKPPSSKNLESVITPVDKDGNTDLKARYVVKN